MITGKNLIQPVAAAALCVLLGHCEGSGGGAQDEGHAGMEGVLADCEFDVLTFTVAGGPLQEVHINGLPVVEVWGANKLEADEVEVVKRRGVRFSDIFVLAGIDRPDETSVNCVARDGWDPLRTRLGGDTSKLPTFSFIRDHAYVYVGSPGDKDPLYPEMEGRSLIVDYDLADDSEVPAGLGGTLVSIGMFRWKMVEKLDETRRGVIEIDPVP
jgi:hypothetical protein